MNARTLDLDSHFINERGFCTVKKMRNLSGGNSVKGALVKRHGTDDEAFISAGVSDTAILGVVLDNGIGQYVEDNYEILCRVVLFGACQVLLTTGTGSKVGWKACASATAGYATCEDAPAGWATTGIGRSLQNITAAAGVIPLCWINFLKP
jgi:hypothetical protein